MSQLAWFHDCALICMICKKFLVIFTLLCAVLILDTPIPASAQTPQGSHPVVKRRVVKRRVVRRNHDQRRKKIVRQGGWAAAGLAAGHAAGPAGSAAVGAAKYRHDLKAGGSRRTKAVAKIGAPIAAGAVAGPAGTAGVEVVEHRNWIKRHVFHKPNHPRRAHAG